MYLSYQTPLVLSFIDYEQALDFIDRTISKGFILAWYTVQIAKVISGICKKTLLRLRQEMKLAAGFALNQELSKTVFHPPLYGPF